jgi:hypothetical protein
LLELLDKLDSGECWSLDTASFHHVSLASTAKGEKTNILCADLANPLFSCTGMKFWLYMTTVILSLPKSIVFVALGSPGSEHSKGAKVGKVIAIGVLIAVTSTYSQEHN